MICRNDGSDAGVGSRQGTLPQMLARRGTAAPARGSRACRRQRRLSPRACRPCGRAARPNMISTGTCFSIPAGVTTSIRFSTLISGARALPAVPVSPRASTPDRGIARFRPPASANPRRRPGQNARAGSRERSWPHCSQSMLKRQAAAGLPPAGTDSAASR